MFYVHGLENSKSGAVLRRSVLAVIFLISKGWGWTLEKPLSVRLLSHRHNVTTVPLRRAFTKDNTYTSLENHDTSPDPTMSRRLALFSGASTCILAATAVCVSNAQAASVVSTTQKISSAAAVVSNEAIPPPFPTEQISPSSLSTSSSSSRDESLSGFVAGAAMAGLKTVVKYPLDTVTVRLQLPNGQYSLQNWPELFEASFNGMATPLVANIPAGAVFFAVRDAVKASLGGNQEGETALPLWAQTCIAVAAAQVPYWLVRNPSEVVKTRQQAKMPGYGEGINMVQGYNQVWLDAASAMQSGKQVGGGGGNSNNATTTVGGGVSNLVDAFYLGYWENILYAYPADVIKFVVYDQWTRQLGGKKNLTPIQGALAGSVSTAIAQLITTPLDVVRNRLMANALPLTPRTTTAISSSSSNEISHSNENDQSKHQKPSYWQTIQNLAQTEGLSGLFAGATPRVSKAIISGAVQFFAYEEVKRDISVVIQKNLLERR